MKKITTLMCAVALWCSAQAQAPALHFGRDGKFRIAQFTDVHLDLGTPYRRAQAEKTIAQMRYILDAEHPDLVVFTGDVVTGKPAAEAWHRVLEPVAERNLPFCVVLGNHDAEQDLTRAEIGRIVTSYAGTLNTLGAGGELADVVLEIAGTTQPAALLYCLDSHDYSTIPSIDGYGWFTQEQVGWLEVNISCPNVHGGGAAFGADPKSAAEVTKAVRAVTKKPIILKLSPTAADIAAVAKACEDAGADGVSLINTLPGMRIDLKRRRPLLANTTGGMSGPGMFPLAVRMVYQVYEAVSIPIVGMGGVTTAADVIELMLAGATAVEVGAANLVDPFACRRIVEDLPRVMQKYNINDLNDIIGGAHHG